MEKSEFFGIEKDKYVPILKDEGIAFLFDLVKKEKPKKILEIGTYIGYSTSVMLSACEGSVVTVEKLSENAFLAKQNLKEFGKRAKVLNEDAYSAILKLEEKGEKFDFIFLDGPKGQYFKYLPHLKNLLNSGGILMADNIYFHGLVKKEGPIIHKHRTIVVNLRKFISSILNDKDFTTTLYNLGDGISVSKRIK